MRVPAVLMRGGTSKGLFFHETDLPSAGNDRDEFILAAYGSPDPYQRQVDGVGGAVSTSSKVAIIGDGRGHGVDVTFEFGQVSIDRAIIDRRGNCGNMSAGVGPFAVDEGLVTTTDPITIVRFLNTNTGKVIVAHVPTRNGKFNPNGDFALSGVPGTGSCIQLDFIEPAGAVTGKLLPTGNVLDELNVPGLGRIQVSLVDAANPLVFVRWQDLGLTGLETPQQLGADTALLARMELVRAHASVLAGIAPTTDEATMKVPSVPKLSIVGAPRDYVTSGGIGVSAGEVDLKASMMSMGRPHNSYPMTGAIATAVAAHIPGTLVNQATTSTSTSLSIGHPAGVLTLNTDIAADGNGWRINSVSGFRTARRLMEGTVLVPDERLSALASRRGNTQ